MTTSRSPVASCDQGSPVVEVHDWQELVTGQGAAAARRLSVRTGDRSCDLAPGNRLVQGVDRTSLHSVTQDTETGDLHISSLDFWTLEE